MKNYLGLLAAVLAFCCLLTAGTVTPARAAECTTQGALALALADVLGIKATSAQAAAEALAAVGVGPVAGAPVMGWDVEACLTDAVSLEIKKSFSALNRGAGEFETILGAVTKPGQQYPGKGEPQLSPFKP